MALKKFINGKYVPVKLGRKKAAPQKLDLGAAVRSLNPDDPAHWTKVLGLPDLRVLTELTGRRVDRAEVGRLFPGYNRRKARG